MPYYTFGPAHYYTTPGLITDVDIYKMIDTSIRGGVSMRSTRHANANNPSLSSYDPELPRRDLIYLDANNLY